LTTGIAARLLLLSRRTTRKGVRTNVDLVIHASTVIAGLVLGTIGHRIPFHAGIGIEVPTGLVTVAAADALIIFSTLIGAGFFAGTVAAGFIAVTIGDRAPFHTGIRIEITALLPAVTRAGALAEFGTFVGAGRNTRPVTASLIGTAGSHRAPFFAGIGIVVTAGAITAAGALALAGRRTFILTGRNTRSVAAGFIRATASYRAPFQAGIRIIVAAGAVPAAGALALAGAGTLVRTTRRRVAIRSARRRIISVAG